MAAGAEVLHEPRTEPWGTSARYRDIDGNVVELTQHVMRFAKVDPELVITGWGTAPDQAAPTTR